MVSKIKEKFNKLDGSRLKEIIDRYRKHQITAYSAQMAFFLFLSIFPLAMFVLSLTSRLNLNIDSIIDNINSGLPEETKEMIINIIDNYLKNDSISLLSISGIAAIWSASRGVISLMRAFNVAYGIDETRNPLYVRIVAMFYTIIFVISIIVTLALPAIGRGFFDYLNQFFNVPNYVTSIYYPVRFILSIIVYVFFILLIHTALPSKKLKFRETISGAIFSVVGWYLLSFGFNYFVSSFTNYALVYGGLASIVTLMMWMYFISIVLMMGAEINSTIIAYRKRYYPFNANIFK